METKVLGTREVLDHHVQALRKGDLDAILDDYTEESVLMVPEAALKDWPRSAPPLPNTCLACSGPEHMS
jgi:ketosteroid isomerase-like protein